MRFRQAKKIVSAYVRRQAPWFRDDQCERLNVSYCQNVAPNRLARFTVAVKRFVRGHEGNMVASERDLSPLWLALRRNWPFVRIIGHSEPVVSRC